MNDIITTIIVRNNALDAIERDPNFNENLVNAIKSNQLTGNPVDVHASNNIRAATVVEQHPADEVVLVSIGYDYGSVFSGTEICFEHHSEEAKINILRDVVKRFGYFLKKRAEWWK